jgi:hypothetical protein
MGMTGFEIYLVAPEGLDLFEINFLSAIYSCKFSIRDVRVNDPSFQSFRLF